MSDTWGSGLDFSGAADGGKPVDLVPQPSAVPRDPQPGPPPEPGPMQSFGQAFRNMLPGPQYNAPDPQASALDQTADTIQQRVKRANEIATNPLLQIFAPEGVQRAREFIPQATEKLQAIRKQKAEMQSNRTEAANMGLAPGEVPDEADRTARLAAASARALKGDITAWKGMRVYDEKAAEAIQDRVFEAAGGHLNDAQFAFDSLANMKNQGQYEAKLRELRADGKLANLEQLGLKVPDSFDIFSKNKGSEAAALRDARIGINNIRTKLEERNTYQPMPKDEAATYSGRLTTAFGDKIEVGQWGHNASSGVRGFIVPGAANPNDLGKTFTLASADQRKALGEEFKQAIPTAELEKFRANGRMYELATTDGKGNYVGDGKINTNPNVQQGIAEGLASVLRGGTGGANIGLLNIETGKRGLVQGLIDKAKTEYAGTLNTISGKELKPYLTNLTQQQQRDVIDVIKAHDTKLIEDRAGGVARRAGALGLDPAALGLGKDESKGAIADALEAGRRDQIARMSPQHQAIGGGDGVFQLGAQRPGAEPAAMPPGTQPTTQLPGAPPVATPVQQAMQPQQPTPAGTPPVLPAAGGVPPAGSGIPGTPGPAGGTPSPAAPVQPVTIAGQQVAVALPPGVSPDYVGKMQRIETPNAKDPWTATTGMRDGKPISSASGAFQFINRTWNENKPAGAPNTAKEATAEQQAQALASFTQKNAAALAKAGIPVNDTNAYVAHNLGAAGATMLLTADPKADARTIVGKDAANNNPKFFRGNPSVETVLARYDDAVNAPAPLSKKDAETAMDKGGSVLDRAAGILKGAGVGFLVGGPAGAAAGAAYKSLPQGAQDAIRDGAIENAPAIGGTIGGVGGAIAGSGAGPAGTVAGGVGGGAAGSAAGQALKDYLQGNPANPREIVKQAALGGVLGVNPAMRAVGPAVRVGGAAAIEGADAALQGGDTADVVDAATKGALQGAGGEMFGRALGMVGHKVFSMFSPTAQKTVQDAAKKFAEADDVLKAETPKVPGANGAQIENPKYSAAEKSYAEAEKVLKDAGLKPDEAAYAARVSADNVPKREAQLNKPGELEKGRLAQGYDQLRQEVGEKGVGQVKEAAKPLQDGPITAVVSGKVPVAFQEIAGRTELAITAPAPSWPVKWDQLQNARSDLLAKEREALASTSSRKSEDAEAYRALADTVRVQQEKAAKYVFGEKTGEEFIQRLKVLDNRYRRLMDATGGDDLVAAAALKGPAGRDVDKKFRAFANDDPVAIAAWDSMRDTGRSAQDGPIRKLVGLVPYFGPAFNKLELGRAVADWARARAAGNPAKFEDFVKVSNGGRAVRDIAGTAMQRAAVQGDIGGGQAQQ